MTAFTVDLDAQYSRKRKKKKKKKTTTQRNSEYFDESGKKLIDKLWFGADGIIRLRSVQNQSELTWGLSPMVGYKFTDNFSAGPRISFQNGILKLSDDLGNEASLNTIDYGAGLWTRHKILQQYFIHAEVELLSDESEVSENNFLLLDPDDPTKILTTRESSTRFYLGPGYTSSFNGPLGFSAYALWDFSQEFNSNNIPIVIRFGLTYNF